ncbi:hypothetical protein [Paenibacillus spongiae]|uniref:Carbohydrate-binding domain-containing protein n=1 Tax=Paenibacillus spongiae TaxID=2909671 RepID=A0ABY5S596_9BACL|nr:hypothetical protein [Paenibacillus spongiae]UVI28864.1 hypothetical protein L1F29_26000 [Paenibacillus spongiae]
MPKKLRSAPNREMSSGPDGQPHILIREGHNGGAAEYPLTEATIASSVNNNHYTVEIAIPWAELQMIPFAPEEGGTIGMSVLATHGPANWEQIMWVGNGDDQSNWADLRFGGTGR